MQIGQHEPGPEHHGRMHVVPTGMGPVRHGRAIRAITLRVRNGKGVDVGPQRKRGTVTAPVPDVTDEPGTYREHTRPQPGLLEPRLDGGGRTELLVAELRVHVQVTPERDKFGTQRLRQRAGKRSFRGKIGLGL